MRQSRYFPLISNNNPFVDKNYPLDVGYRVIMIIFQKGAYALYQAREVFQDMLNDSKGKV